MGETLKDNSLTRLWPAFSKAALGLYLFILLTVAAAGWVQLISRSTLFECAAALIAIGLAMVLVEAVLKRLGYVAKGPGPVSLDEQAPRQPEPPPITQPAELDRYAEPEKAFEETLTPLGGGALPGRFDRQGRKATWRVAGERSGVRSPPRP